MITKTVIKVLRDDSTIQSLFGVDDEDNCPVFTTYNFEDTLNKQINVTLAYGETQPFDPNIHDGNFIVYVLVKDTLSYPIQTLHNIANAVISALDLKGTDLDEDSIVYWIQKLDTDFTHYEDIHFYELAITFRFYIEETS